MISKTSIATTLLVLFGFAQALPIRPLSCASPQPLFGPHTAPGFVGGTELDDFSLEVRINGQILNPAEAVSLLVNANNVIELIATGDMIFRGFLLKLSSTDGADTTGYLVSSDDNIDTSDSLDLCTALNASSLSHTSNMNRTSIKARLMIDETFDDLKLEATVVISNGVAAPGSEWYQSSYNITVTDLGMCFPGDATVELQDGTIKAMKNLQLGDVVLTDGANNNNNKLYEPIYSFGHVNAKASSEFVQLKTTTTTLELTKDHMVFVEGNRAVPASSIQVGDNLVMASGDLEAVKDIKKVVRKGIYAPFTPSGSIVVNGVKASNFLSFQDGGVLKIGGFSTGLTYQWMSHTFELPHRVWCHYLGQCKNEQYTTDGVTTWMALPHQVALWFFQQNAIVMTAVAVPVLLGLVSLWTLEHVVVLLLTAPGMAGVIAGLLVLSHRRVKTI